MNFKIVFSLILILLLLSGCPKEKTKCGNGICEKDENISTCRLDCSFEEKDINELEEKLEEEECVKEGEDLGALVLENTKKCCEGLTAYIPPGLIGTMGTCIKPTEVKEANLKVKVVDSTGAPIDHAYVYILKDNEGIDYKRPNEQGEVSFTLEIGEYEVYAGTALGFEDSEKAKVELGEEGKEITIVLISYEEIKATQTKPEKANIEVTHDTQEGKFTFMITNKSNWVYPNTKLEISSDSPITSYSINDPIGVTHSEKDLSENKVTLEIEDFGKDYTVFGGLTTGESAKITIKIVSDSEVLFEEEI